MEFSEWLQEELNKRSWDQTELARRSGITTGQVSRILNGTRQAGPEACIAIAQALHLPREEVFRARGWLLREPEQLVMPNIDPKAAQIAQDVSKLPPDIREAVLGAMQATLDAVRKSNL